MTRQEREMRSKLAKLDRTLRAAVKARDKAQARADRAMAAISRLLSVKVAS